MVGLISYALEYIHIFKYAWSEQKVCILCIMLHIVLIISLLYLKIRDSYSNNHNVPYLRIPSLIILHEALYLSIYHICLYSIYLSIYLMRILPGTCASLSIYPSPPIRRENQQRVKYNVHKIHFYKIKYTILYFNFICMSEKN